MLAHACQGRAELLYWYWRRHGGGDTGTEAAIRNRGVVVVQEDFDIFIETIAGLRILCAQQEEGPTTTAAPAEAPEPEPEA